MFSALFHWNPFCVPCGPTVWKVEWIMLVESGKWDVACGMWNVACGMRNVACDIRHVACGKWSVEGGMSNDECRMSNDEWNVACGMWHVKAVHRLSSLQFSDVCSHRWTHNAYCEQCARFLPLTALHVLTFFTLTALEGADTRPPTHTRAVAVAISPNDPAVCPNGWTRNSYCGEYASFPPLTVLFMFSTLFHGNHSVFRVWAHGGRRNGMLVESGKCHVESGMWQVEFGVWQVECAMLNGECGMWNVT